MIRKQPENTQWFEYVNRNPKNVRTTDCVIRGLAGAVNKSWEDVYKELFSLAIRYSRPAEDDFIVEKYLENNGAIRIAQPRTCSGKKLYGREVCGLIQEGKFIDNDGVVIPYKNYYLNLGSGHAACIVNGKIQDIWNSSLEKVGKMWAIPKEGVYDYE